MANVDIQYLIEKASLPELRRWSAAVMTAYIEQTRRPEKIKQARAIARGVYLGRFRMFAGLVAQSMWLGVTLVLDDLIDGDMNDSRDPKWYLDRMELLIAALDDPTKGQGVEAEGPDFLAICAIRQAEWAGRPVVPILKMVWEGYSADARRRIDDVCFPSRALQERVDESNAALLAALDYLRGVPFETALPVYRRVVTILNAAVNLQRLPREIEVHQAHIPREDLVEAGIDPDLLATCRSWAELNRVPGFRKWAVAALTKCRDDWQASGLAEELDRLGLMAPAWRFRRGARLSGQAYRRLHSAINGAFQLLEAE